MVVLTHSILQRGSLQGLDTDGVVFASSLNVCHEKLYISLLIPIHWGRGKWDGDSLCSSHSDLITKGEVSFLRSEVT